MAKKLFEKKLLGIHYNADKTVKAIDVQGMTLIEIADELSKKVKEGKIHAKGDI